MSLVTAIVFDEDGEIIEQRSGQQVNVYKDVAKYGNQAIFLSPTEDAVSIESHYVDPKTRKPVKKPKQPTERHSWNKKKRLWEVDHAAIHARVTAEVRKMRTSLLAQSDWTQIPDAPVTGQDRAAWQQYRQELRDLMSNLPEQLYSIGDVVFPDPPTSQE